MKEPFFEERRNSLFRTAVRLLIYISATGWGAFAQTPAFQMMEAKDQQVYSLDVEDGLSQGGITDLHKDARGFLWVGTREGLNRYDGRDFKVYRHKEQDSTALYGNHVFGIVEDAHGDLWVGTELCLNRYRRSTDLFSYIHADGEGDEAVPAATLPVYADSSYVWYLSAGEGLCRYDFLSGEKVVFEEFARYKVQPSASGWVLRDHHGRFWFREDSGMRCFDPESGDSRFYFSRSRFNISGAPLQIFDAAFSEDGGMWLGGEQGLWCLDTATMQAELISATAGFSAAVLRLAADGAGTWWLLTDSDGLWSFSPAEETWTIWAADRDCPMCRQTGKGSKLIVDDQGIIWVSTPPSGFDKIIPWPKAFQGYQPSDQIHSFSRENSVLALEESAGGQIWMGLENGSVALFDPRSGQSRALNASFSSSFRPGFFRKLEEEVQGRMWAGTDQGLCYYDQNERQWKQVLLAGSVPEKAHAINDLLPVADTLLLVAAADGIYTVHTGTYRSRRLVESGEDPVWALALSENKELMAAVGYEGFRRYEWKADGSLHLLEKGRRGYQVNAFWRSEAEGEWWLATNKGLCQRKDGAAAWTCHLQQGGLASEFIHAMLEDEQGGIWVSTNQGLSKYDRKEKRFFSFGPEDGVQSLQFNSGAALRTRDGVFYFGGTNGFNRFVPESISLEAGPAYSVYLTNLEVNDRPFRNQGYIGELHHLRLNHAQNTFSLEFVALDYLSHGHNHYRYRLLGLEEEWTDLYHQNKVRYVKLPPGSYTFEVMAANDQMIWNPFVRRLNIEITAPWWMQWWANLLFLLLAVGIISSLYRYRLRRREARDEAQRLRTLDEIKNRFLTHITHAFRTPLTVITTPVSRALKEERPLEEEELRLIFEHGEQLKYFIDDLLDLRSIEAATLEPRYIYGDLVSYTQYIIDAFQGQAAAKNVELEFQAEQDYLLMNYDRKKMLQILSHLLNNALKYSPEKERVLVSLTREEDLMKLQVADRGPGIAPEILPHIFQKFYHSDHEQYGGTGIGLAIVKELVRLIEGKISVDSRPGRGARFTVKLPIKQGAPPEEEVPADITLPSFSYPGAVKAGYAYAGTASGQKILLIEDNPAVRRLIAYCLQDQYLLEFAPDGTEGLEKAFAEIPDLVLCDIMMPEMSGYQVCRRLKDDERTSHIPVILLTALGDADSRVKGLTAGADAYLSKPFDDRELQEQIKQLLLQRRRLQSAFQKQTVPAVDTTENPDRPQQEDPFLKRFREMVEKELANPDFSVPKLCKEIGMSHTQLHRKLKATTGMSAIQLIKSIRMERAKTLLEDTDLSIGEIAYQTGYNDPSYFGRVFAKYTGKPPSNYREEAF